MFAVFPKFHFDFGLGPVSLAVLLGLERELMAGVQISVIQCAEPEMFRTG